MKIKTKQKNEFVRLISFAFETYEFIIYLFAK